MKNAELRWNVRLPPNMEAVRRMRPGLCVTTNTGPLDVPWPPLSPAAIAAAKDTASDWQLNPGFVPIMGDMHDLVCLDYATAEEPGVVILDDARTELARFASLNDFLAALMEPDGTPARRDVDEEQSWLDF